MISSEHVNYVDEDDDYTLDYGIDENQYNCNKLPELDHNSLNVPTNDSMLVVAATQSHDHTLKTSNCLPNSNSYQGLSIIKSVSALWLASLSDNREYTEVATVETEILNSNNNDLTHSISPSYKIIPGKSLKSNNSQIFAIEAMDKRENRINNTASPYTDSLTSSIHNNNGINSNDMKDFIFNISVFPLKISHNLFPTDLSRDSFNSIEHLTDGSNCNIFQAIYLNNKIILKVISDTETINIVSMKEFEREILVLSRISHPHIVNIFGTGTNKSKLNSNFNRPLIVLEALNGGTLAAHLNVKSSLSLNLMRSNRPFSTLRYLRIAKEFADALYYLHEKFHSECTIIHRDLKPDNIGFTADGTLKLIDFGLCIAVKTNALIRNTYCMTGFTGSMRYMSPEVASYKAYNEKVDIYSFGIILYQVITNDLPFRGLTKNQFLQLVVKENLRPNLEYDSMNRLINMKPCIKQFLIKCWDPLSRNRPSAANCFSFFDQLYNEKLEKKKNESRLMSVWKSLVNSKDSI